MKLPAHWWTVMYFVPKLIVWSRILLYSWTLNLSYYFYSCYFFLVMLKNFFFFYPSLSSPQVIVGEGYWGTRCTAQIVERNELEGCDWLWSSTQRTAHFPPARCVFLREGGRRVVGVGGQTGDIHIPLGLNGSRNPTHSIVAFSNSNAGILDRRGWGGGG